MASVLQQYRQLADITALQITGSYQSWTDFLTTAARLYKYPYHEQPMIYAQRPEATACADYELWNKRMGRYVRRGAKGIALIDHSGDAPKLKYVFDVADTRTTERSRSPYLWEYRPEHAQVVPYALEEQFNIQYTGNLVDQLEQISSVKVTEYFLAHQQDILGIVDGSYLEGYHDYDKGVAFINAATISVNYALLSRCNLLDDAHFGAEDFMPVFDFNTPQTVYVACKEAIEAAIREHYHDKQLDSQAAAQVVKAFGLDRTLYVLANTVQQKDWDGRISPGNKAWAKTIPVQKNPDAWGADRNCQYVVNSHSGLTDLFLSTVRQEYCQKQEKAHKLSVRAKLQNQPVKNSPKISANFRDKER